MSRTMMTESRLSEIESMVEHPWFTVEAAGRIAACVPELVREVRFLREALEICRETESDF